MVAASAGAGYDISRNVGGGEWDATTEFVTHSIAPHIIIYTLPSVVAVVDKYRMTEDYSL